MSCPADQPFVGAGDGNSAHSPQCGISTTADRGPRPGVRSGTKTVAEKEFSALGPIAKALTTGAAAAETTRLSAEVAEPAELNTIRAPTATSSTPPRWTGRSPPGGGAPPTRNPSSPPTPGRHRSHQPRWWRRGSVGLGHERVPAHDSTTPAGESSGTSHRHGEQPRARAGPGRCCSREARGHAKPCRSSQTQTFAPGKSSDRRTRAHRHGRVLGGCFGAQGPVAGGG